MLQKSQQYCKLSATRKSEMKMYNTITTEIMITKIIQSQSGQIRVIEQGSPVGSTSESTPIRFSYPDLVLQLFNCNCF